MTAEPTRDWTVHDLERYLDGDLGTDAEAALAEDLRRSPALRDRLDRVRRLDAEARVALLAPTAAHHSRRLSPVATGIALAAGLLIVVVTGVMLAPRSTPPVPPTITVIEPLPPSPAESTRIVEVLRLPASASTRSLPKLGAPEPKPPALAAAAPPSLPLPELKRSLAHGDVTEALRLIEQADGPEREQACRVIGQALASAWTAEQVLDGLTPRDQLEVCRAWAADQRFLVETFDRLAVLANDPTIRVEFEDVIRELAAEQGLRGWMRKSGLADLADPGRPVG